MDAPPDKEDIGPFIDIAQLLVGIGVNAPVIQERNVAEGYLLLSDFGNCTYLMEIERPGVADAAIEGLYADALAALIRIQAQGSEGAARLPGYDRPTLKREMDLFPEWFVGRHLGLSLTAAERADLTRIEELLIAAALEQPQVLVHRDYHSRNLMVCEPGRPGILDFQDAVRGPITYDLVSLLRDCYVAWPAARVKAWIGSFREQAAQSRLPVGRDAAEFTRWFDFMGVQRHLKVAGIFSRLWHRDGKRGYLKDIPRTVNYLLSVSREHAELRPLAELLERRILPAMQSAAVSPSAASAPDGN